jgi:hypothetical protein
MKTKIENQKDAPQADGKSNIPLRECCVLAECDVCLATWLCRPGIVPSVVCAEDGCPFAGKKPTKVKKRRKRRTGKPATIQPYEYWKIGRDRIRGLHTPDQWQRIVRRG